MIRPSSAPAPAASRTRAERAARRVAWTIAALLGVLASDAAACPYCSLSQGADTLVYIAGFLIIPYVVVSLTWLWIKRVLASEGEG